MASDQYGRPSPSAFFEIPPIDNIIDTGAPTLSIGNLYKKRSNKKKKSAKTKKKTRKCQK